MEGLSRQAEYANAKPFPHVVIDDFLPGVADLFPDRGIWKLTENRHTSCKWVTKGRGLKWDLFTEGQKKLFTDLSSAPFLQFLEELTTIKGLVPDPYFVEGGFHKVGDKGRLGIHADFSHHPHLGLERRVNLLLYLNKEWKPEWGGALNLYDEEIRVVRSIQPILNRCVIFSTSHTSYHGHPDPMALPQGVFRKSLALYYYSSPTRRDKRGIFFPCDPGFTSS